jgi:hypothetical protein
MKFTNYKCTLLLGVLAFTATAFAEKNIDNPRDYNTSNADCSVKPQGWSLDLGGTYTWMSLTTPPTYSGSTGGFQAKVTHQKPWSVFGQARSFYNLGTLSSSLNNTSLNEWYMEFVGGYSFPILKNWSFTPYAGLGIDFLHDYHDGYSSFNPIQLRYNLYYAVAGFDTHYTWCNWMLGLQADCLPTFNQYLNIKALPQAAWELSTRTGAAVRLPIAYRFVKNCWVELAPYYRWLPIGKAQVLGLPHRNLTQWGAFVTLRFFI